MNVDDASADRLLVALETHDLTALTAVLDAGIDGTTLVRGKTPVQWLLEMYFRSPRFPACLRVLLERGGRLDEPELVPVLLDDALALAAVLTRDPRCLAHRVSLPSAFTPLVGASLLHVAAEFGCANATEVLLAAGADVEARAAGDGEGEGHTALFHCVNSLLDHAAPILRRLLAAGARTDVLVARLTWGRGFDWETTFYDVTPINYCHAGLLPQMHRGEAEIQANLDLLLAQGKRPPSSRANVPNRYLRPRGA